VSIPERALGEVLSLDLDEVPVDPEDTYRISGVYGFGRGLFARGAIQGNETSYAKLNRLHTGMLVMSRLKAFEGALSVIPSSFDGWYLSQEFPTFKVDESNLSIRYLANLCAWPEFWGRLSAESKGLGARKERVSADRLLSIKVPLPDLPEQRRIAARLDSAKAASSEIRQLMIQAGRLRSGILESVFQALDGCASRRLGDVLELDRVPIQVEPDGEYVQIGIRSFGKGIFLRDRLTGNELSKLKYFEVHPGRLVVSNIMAWEGAIAVSKDEHDGCVGSHRFLSYAAVGDVDVHYLNYYFQTRFGRENIRGTSTGTVLRNQTLSIKDFGTLAIPLPSLEKQKLVVRQLDSVMSAATLARRQDCLLLSCEKALVNAAFNGAL
jgi:type I restriction enzyme S subunit